MQVGESRLWSYPCRSGANGAEVVEGDSDDGYGPLPDGGVR